jgi:hypothetical protein
MTREMEIAQSVNAVLAPWIEAEREQVKRHLEPFSEEFCAFAEWAEDYGVSPWAGGHVVAGYLLELAADGAPLAVLMRALDGIDFFYRLCRQYLNPEPLDAVLALVASQMSPDRTLN